MERQPLFFPLGDTNLFGWLHWPASGAQRDCVAVLCGPIGHEYVHSHRSMRHLADQLARSGIPALRFDYHGCGDSPGDDLDPDRLEAWEKSVQAARDFAVQATGCSKVCLIGLRLGAALAARVSARQPADFLVLWEPVVSGKRYVREIRAVAASAALEGAGNAGAQTPIEAAGFQLSEQTATDLKRLDLMSEGVVARERVLLLNRDDLGHESAFAAKLLADGARLEERFFTGYAAMMAEPQFTQVPEGALACMIDWLVRQTLPGSHAQPSAVSAGAGNQFSQGRFSEQACQFGEKGGLFGILSRPASGAAPGLPAVVLLNAGSVHHIGPNRLYVSLARQLAGAGHVALRLDLRGLGDSIAEAPQKENHPYPDWSVADTREALAFLKKELGVTRFVLLGLCSGAHTAFHAAIELAEFEIIDTILINPLTFHWTESLSLSTATPRLQEVAYYRQALRNPRKWLSLLQGRVRIRRGLKILWGQVHRVLLNLMQGRRAVPFQEDFTQLFAQGRSLSLFVARQDPGYDLLLAAAGPLVRRARASGKLRVQFIEKGDHTFSSRVPRDELLGRIGARLLELPVSGREALP